MGVGVGVGVAVGVGVGDGVGVGVFAGGGGGGGGVEPSLSSTRTVAPEGLPMLYSSNTELISILMVRFVITAPSSSATSTR